MRMMVVFAKVVAVVGSDQRNVEFFLQPKEIGMNLLFQFESLVLNLQKEVASPKMS